MVRLLAMVARRIVWMPPTLFGLVLLVFAISHVVPSDPARVMAGENAPPEQVEALRRRLAADATLAEMAEARPSSLDELAAIGGVGAKKLDAYGEDILRVLAET